ncbi:hypothetical protein TNCV_1965541 [Trichonephila clavipes]|nr:hypothetical protein TNCV_1965541 [Trichonephila clavipes]
MPPVGRSRNEAHEIHPGKGLEVRLSLAYTLSTIQETVRISSAKFPEGMIDGVFTYFYLHNFAMELEGKEIFSKSPALVIQPTRLSDPLI